MQTIHQLAGGRAAVGDFDDPATLVPAYIREPEAVTLWDEKQSNKTAKQ